MLEKKINKFSALIKEIQNDINLFIISDFLDWFYKKININFNWKTPNLKFKKWEIYFVNLWKNIWSELNKTRPFLIYSKKSFNIKWWLVWIPLKSFKWKDLIEKVQIKILKSDKNNLEKNSICDIFYLRNISTKRVNDFIWKLEEKYLEEIDNKVKYMFDIK